MTASPNEDQFHEHISSLEEHGIEFPRQGMVQMGGKMYPLGSASHGVWDEEGGSSARQTEIAISSETFSNPHYLSFTRHNPGSEITGAGYHPPTGKGMMFRMYAGTPSREIPGKGAEVGDLSEFIERSTAEISRLEDLGRKGEVWTGNPGHKRELPVMEHDVELTHIDPDKSGTSWATYDPNSRTLTPTDQPRDKWS